ncbi:hypothetical protein [Paraburkholderia phenoliruptrix]|uniref:hypothetical protein n=1 Tax=Paraburkholderia phenoliruptrix TaxID=252970 RepID=UPI001581DE80|nr:hypothetical protein [Paraburkholderia phenoliruptrix]
MSAIAKRLACEAMHGFHTKDMAISPARETRGHRHAQVSGAKRISAYLCNFCEVLEI